MSGITFTPEQREAVENRGGALLVSAAAGSGKTRVLVERLLAYVSDAENGHDIGDFLVITYTRAAAAELRGKIIDAISERLALEPGNRRLRRQASLCYGAHISTIHGFCTEILRENAHLAGITPDFRVADESESGIIKASVLENVLNTRYERIGETPDFALLVDTMSAGRDDSRLIEIVLDTHAKLQSHPYPARWVEEQLGQLNMSVVRDVSETIWGAYLLDEALKTALYWKSYITALISEAFEYPDFFQAYGESLAATEDSMRLFTDALGKGWDEARKYSEIAFPRAKNVKGYECLKEKRKRCKAALAKLSGMFECSSSELIEDMEAVRPAVSELLRLVLDFDAAYASEKRRRGLLDFSDLEHLSINLLVDPATGGPTSAARDISRLFEEIMVDEYQDVNAVQEMIFQAVSREGKNIFMVGDVKQSIYRFRLADPHIFLGKYRRFSTESGSESGKVVLLPDNFRSRKGILDAVNFIFSNIMSEDFGEMAYTQREYLRAGRQDAEPDNPAVELDVIDMCAPRDGGEGEKPDKGDAEAAFIAGRIDEIISCSTEIPDGQGGTRRVRCSDFAILLRSMKDRAWRYAAALKAYGIAVSLPGGAGFFDSFEISCAVALLEIVDNPMQDIPLVTVLTSPVYGFTADDLAGIRSECRGGNLYEALTEAAGTEAKYADFLNELNGFRLAAPDMTADEVVWYLYNKTNLLGIMGAMPGGEGRRANLMLLLEYARLFEANGYRGLFGFITYLRRLIERGEDPGGQSEAPAGDAVRIMSIHKSKGLEFPFVVLADTSKQINIRDTVRPLLIHPQLGVGAKRTDTERRIEFPTLARMAVSRKIASETMAEELRVLYVAMTRAREKLIIACTYADAGKELDKLAKNTASPVPPQALEEAKSMAGWILLAAMTRPEAKCLRLDNDVQVIKDCGGAWDVRLIKAPTAEIQKNGPTEAESAEEPEKAPAVAATALRERFAFDYPYKNAVELPSKLTATELKGRFRDMEAAEEAQKPQFAKKHDNLFSRPDFIVGKSALTGAERGTALHLVLQYIDFGKCSSVEEITGEIKKLANARLITPQQGEAADPEKILEFFSSPLGRRAVSAGTVYREFKFSLLTPASDFFPGGGDDKILFQGVVDCCFEENGVLTVIDFKTDYVTEKTIGEKKALYTPQINAYASAMERVTGKHVAEKALYFFALGRSETV